MIMMTCPFDFQHLFSDSWVVIRNSMSLLKGYSMTDITIKIGLDDVHRDKASTLYYTAFRQKLHPIFRDEQRGLAVLTESLNPQYAIVALHEGDLVGLAGFKDDHGTLIDLQTKTMTKTFGFIGGWWRLLALSLFERKKQAGVLLMDGIVVDDSMRGLGIGSRLLNAVVDYARDHAYAEVRLDVVDTNPRARQLYERKGFVATDTERYPYLKPIFGFAGSTTMLKPIN